jgi:hypothetical protein
MPLYRITESIYKEKSKEILTDKVIVASSFSKKLFGLITGPELDDNTCFLIENCSSIHTVGMKYSLDIIFLNEHGNIIRIFEKMPPFRFTPFIKNAKKVVELYPGSVSFKKITCKDLLAIQ